MPENKTWDDSDEGREREVNTSERGEGMDQEVSESNHRSHRGPARNRGRGVHFLPLQLC